MCPVIDLRNAGVPVGLGVDGVASNEVGGLFPELRQALYTARIREGRADALMPEDALEIGTIGGAKCLGLDQFGLLEIGAPADFAVWEGSDIAGIEDPIAGLVLGPDRRVRELFVNGVRRVSEGELIGVDLTEAHRRLALRSKRLWNT